MKTILALVLQELYMHGLFCEFTLRFLLRKFSVWLALEVILLICLSHFRFDCKVTPRYFVESVFFLQESDHEVYMYIG